jgi:hypothetical protein
MDPKHVYKCPGEKKKGGGYRVDYGKKNCNRILVLIGLISMAICNVRVLRTHIILDV